MVRTKAREQKIEHGGRLIDVWYNHEERLWVVAIKNPATMADSCESSYVPGHGVAHEIAYARHRIDTGDLPYER